MNKQLRYTTHILAILLMAGSMQSLLANKVWFCNESNEEIEFETFIDHEEYAPHHGLFNTLEPFEKDIQFRAVDSIRPEYRHCVNADECYIRSIYAHIVKDEKPKKVFVFAEDVHENKQDMKVVYKGNGTFNIYLVSYQLFKEVN